MRYNFAADSFHIMKLCSRLFVLHCRSRPKYDISRHFDPHFEEFRGGVEPWWMARWKARLLRQRPLFQLFLHPVRRQCGQNQTSRTHLQY